MTEQTTAVQTAETDTGLALPTQNVVSIATLGEVERIEQTVVLPPIYQYAINRYGQPPKVMLTSDAYDYINRAMGVQLFQPAFVNDEAGNKVRNPIHRPDYIYIRMYGIWTNDLGQTVSYREDVEVDFNLVYHDARINSKSARVQTDENGFPVFENGVPIVRLDPADELKALKALSQLRTFGLRYAQTVAKTRILKTASGVRTLPIAAPRPYPIKVVGFRDKLTPDERIKRAGQGMEAMFGASERLDENIGLSSEEMGEIQDLIADDETEDLERDLVESAQRSDEAPDERRDISRVKRVGATEGLGLGDEPAGTR